jgi:hypothetical protein
VVTTPSGYDTARIRWLAESATYTLRPHRMYQLNGFRKSTPLQKLEFIVYLLAKLTIWGGG